MTSAAVRSTKRGRRNARQSTQDHQKKQQLNTHKIEENIFEDLRACTSACGACLGTNRCVRGDQSQTPQLAPCLIHKREQTTTETKKLRCNCRKTCTWLGQTTRSPDASTRPRAPRLCYPWALHASVNCMHSDPQKKKRVWVLLRFNGSLVRSTVRFRLAVFYFAGGTALVRKITVTKMSHAC
jgi:hypothetical protein